MSLITPDKFNKYKILYIDPPWMYNDKTPRGGAENHYNTMSTEDLCKLPIGSFADQDCALFMWGTYPKLPDALQCMEAWGFTYKTIAFQWVKTYASGKLFWGMGRWTRANTEPCFLAIKGKPQREAMNVHQVVYSEIRKHSEKPPEIRDHIKSLMGEVPALEIFARQAVPGYDNVGYELGTVLSPEGIILR